MCKLLKYYKRKFASTTNCLEGIVDNQTKNARVTCSRSTTQVILQQNIEREKIFWGISVFCMIKKKN